MRNARRFTGWGAAAMAVALVATAAPAAALPIEETPAAAVETPAPAEALETPVPDAGAAPEPAASASLEATPTESATATAISEADAPDAAAEQVAPAEELRAARAAAVGDLEVTVFDDRYADGAFDTTKQARDGWTDVTGRDARLLTSAGTWINGYPDADGVIRFEDVPVGPSQVHVAYPTGPSDQVFFTPAATGIERLPEGDYLGTPTGVADVTVDEDGASLVIGMAALRAVAEVEYEDGAPASDVTVEFGSGGEWFAAAEYAGSLGGYEARRAGTTGPLVHLPDEIGVRVTAPAGHRVDGVTAISDSGNTTDFIDVTERDGAYWIDSVDAARFSSSPTFTVTLEEVTGDLLVTGFDDRYADGLFDRTLGAGEKVDAKNTRIAGIVTSTGQVRFPSIDPTPAGDYLFTDVPVGETEVFFSYPNGPAGEVFFDATDATSAAGIERLPSGSFRGMTPSGVATVTVDEDGEELLVGMSALRAVAQVEYADGTPATGLEVAFGSQDEVFTATEYSTTGGPEGTYEAFQPGGYVRHLPGALGVTVAAPEGYRVGEVTAAGNNDPWAQEIPVTEDAGVYRIDTVGANSYFSAPTFTVTLEEVPTASLEVNYFLDVVLDGLHDAAGDLPVDGETVYLQDADGEWFATTAGADGTYRFDGAAVGPATLYTGLPEAEEIPEIPGAPAMPALPETLFAVWDATGLTSHLQTVRADTRAITFTGGTAVDPLTGAETPIDVVDELVAAIPTELVEGEQAKDIGAAGVLQLAVAAGIDGAPMTENVTVEFLANGEVAAAADLGAGDGSLVATEDGELAVFGAAEFGVRAIADEGYEIVSVTALNALTGEALELSSAEPLASARMALFAAPAGEFRVAPQQVGVLGFGAVVWAVEVAPVAVAPTVPGVTPGIALPSGGQSAAAPGVRVLPATGSDVDTTLWMLAASLLIAAGLGTRLAVRRRQG